MLVVYFMRHLGYGLDWRALFSQTSITSMVLKKIEAQAIPISSRTLIYVSWCWFADEHLRAHTTHFRQISTISLCVRLGCRPASNYPNDISRM